MQKKSEIITLHKYFLNASAMRKHFLETISSDGSFECLPESTNSMIYLSLWYGCLRVVIEGWELLGLKSDIVAELLVGSQVVLLNGFRNDTFHFQKEYIAKRSQKVFIEKDFVKWAHEVHIALGAQLILLMKETGK